MSRFARNLTNLFKGHSFMCTNMNLYDMSRFARNLTNLFKSYKSLLQKLIVICYQVHKHICRICNDL